MSQLHCWQFSAAVAGRFAWQTLSTWEVALGSAVLADARRFHLENEMCPRLKPWNVSVAVSPGTFWRMTVPHGPLWLIIFAVMRPIPISGRCNLRRFALHVTQCCGCVAHCSCEEKIRSSCLPGCRPVTFSVRVRVCGTCHMNSTIVTIAAILVLVRHHCHQLLL